MIVCAVILSALIGRHDYLVLDASQGSSKTINTHAAANGDQFKSLDANNDGFVTVEEMIAIIPVPAAAPKVEEKKADQPAK